MYIVNLSVLTHVLRLYGVCNLVVQVCGLRLSVGMWHFVPVSRHLVAC